MKQSLSSLLISNKLVLQDTVMLLQWPLEDSIMNGKLAKQSAVRHSEFYCRRRANSGSKWAVYRQWRNCWGEDLSSGCEWTHFTAVFTILYQTIASQAIVSSLAGLQCKNLKSVNGSLLTFLLIPLFTQHKMNLWSSLLQESNSKSCSKTFRKFEVWIQFFILMCRPRAALTRLVNHWNVKLIKWKDQTHLWRTKRSLRIFSITKHLKEKQPWYFKSQVSS